MALAALRKPVAALQCVAEYDYGVLLLQNGYKFLMACRHHRYIYGRHGFVQIS
jgi:hypothetical protein